MDQLAINRVTALKMYWDKGFNNEELMLIANAALDTLKQPSKGYFYADDVANLIKTT